MSAVGVSHCLSCLSRPVFVTGACKQSVLQQRSADITHLIVSKLGVSNLFDRRAKCINFKLVGGQIEMPKASRGGREWGGVSPPQPTSGSMGSGEHRKLPGPPTENEFWRILELEKAHLIDTNLSFLTFLGDLTGRIETPGRPDCGPWAVCWTLLFYLLSSCQKLLESVKI